MDILPVALGSFLLLAGAVYLVLRPTGDTAKDPEESPRHALEVERDKQIEVIRDLDLDLATGKLSTEDHARMRAAAVTRAAELLRELDEMRAEVPDAEEASDVGPVPVELVAAATEDVEAEPDASEDDLERVIAARRRDLEHRSCPGCGAVHAEADRFCRVCGEAFVTTGRQVGR